MRLRTALIRVQDLNRLPPSNNYTFEGNSLADKELKLLILIEELTGPAPDRDIFKGESPCPLLSTALPAHNLSIVGPYRFDATADPAGS